MKAQCQYLMKLILLALLLLQALSQDVAKKNSTCKKGQREKVSKQPATLCGVEAWDKPLNDAIWAIF